MIDRAEQAKALIEESEGFDPHPRSAGGKNHTTQYAVLLIERLAAALTTSEAEVTRLETGIAEALIEAANEFVELSPNSTEETMPLGNRYVTTHEWLRHLAALSQPTTDTQRIDLLLSKRPDELTPDELTEVGRALGAIEQPTTDTNGAHA